jgi:transcriptional regulator with XRE-family HTH domain
MISKNPVSTSNLNHDVGRKELSTARAVDVHVGRRIRTLRMERKVTIADLAGSIGVTAQQLQKYESGANRIGSSKLYVIAQTLEIEVGALFADLPRPARCSPTKTAFARAAFASTSEGIQLLDIVRNLPGEIRNEAVRLVLAIASCCDPNERPM